jgi:hypothetical protein
MKIEGIVILATSFSMKSMVFYSKKVDENIKFKKR